MAATVVQSKIATSIATVSSLTATLTTGATTGNCLVVAVAIFSSSGQTITGVSTTGGTGSDSFGPAVYSVSPGHTTSVMSFYLLPACGAGRTGVTATFSAATNASDICVWEVSGLPNAVLDRTATNGAATGTTASAGPTAALSSSSEFVATFTVTGGGCNAFTSPWTSDGVTANTGTAFARQVVATNAAISGTNTLTTSATWDSLIA